MKILFFLLITLFFATIGFADVSHQLDETNKKIEKIEEKLDTTKEELTKYTQITEDTKERVGDISSSVDRFGILVTFFGVLITGIVIFFSFRSTNEAKLEAKIVAQEEAQKEARKLLNEWIEKEAKVKGDEVLKRIEEKADAQHERFENRMLNLNPNQKEKDELAREAKKTETKKEEDLTLNDYSIKIANNFHQENYDEVLILVDKAMTFTSINIEQMAGLLVLKGAALNQIAKFDEAIKIFDVVITTYKIFKVPKIVEMVAMATVNKGIALVGQDKFDEALKIWDELIFLYKDSKSKGIIAQVKNALQNKLEIEIISDKEISNDRTLIDKLNRLPKDKASIDMLFILQNAKTSPQDIELHSWLEKYKDEKALKWSFNELEKWITNATYSDDIKQRIRSYIETFKTHLHRA